MKILVLPFEFALPRSCTIIGHHEFSSQTNSPCVAASSKHLVPSASPSSMG